MENKNYNGFLYCEIRKVIFGFHQAGKLANTLLKKRLATYGYIECMHTPGLWPHIFCPVQFTLVVDDFGVKFIGVEQLQHLVESLKKLYEILLDPTGSTYCGITLEWEYNNRTVDLSTPNYVPTKLKEFGHPKPSKPQHAPHKATPRFSNSQKLVPVDDSPQFSKERTKPFITDRRVFLILCTVD